jgi:hypothetical protein
MESQMFRVIAMLLIVDLQTRYYSDCVGMFVNQNFTCLVPLANYLWL